MTQITPHFSLSELTVTSHNSPNTPNKGNAERLLNLAKNLELVRTLLGKPIKINSAFRSPAVNKAVNGAPTSAHLAGDAADFVCPAFGSPYEIAKAISKSGIKYDQLIQEKGQWVHISFAVTMRQQDLTFDGKTYRPGISAPK